MRATGIVRRVDDLGRIVIPREIRRTNSSLPRNFIPKSKIFFPSAKRLTPPALTDFTILKAKALPLNSLQKTEAKPTPSVQRLRNISAAERILQADLPPSKEQAVCVILLSRTKKRHANFLAITFSFPHQEWKAFINARFHISAATA